MAMKIPFDASGNPEELTFILAKRNGQKLGQINALHVHIGDDLKKAAEFSFQVYKEFNGEVDSLWNYIRDFKLVWVQDCDMWFEIHLDLTHSNEVVKTVYGVRLGEAELSQIMLYNIEINTELDISRDDYVRPTVFYDADHKDASLLHRIFEKAGHYTIDHVDTSLMNVQRTFQFDDVSIYDACQQIGKEIGCLFVFPSDSYGNGKPNRRVNVYDIETYCYNCGYRGDYKKICPKCSSTVVSNSYGEDTTIFVTADELGDNLQYTTDTDSVKNCFRLVAGDDLMTATIRSCNPNGSDYIWYITDDTKEDMPEELVTKINAYDQQFAYYQSEYPISLNATLLNKYNQLATKYSTKKHPFDTIANPIIGFTNLINAYYNTIDLALYLQTGMLPSVETSGTTAAIEVTKLRSYDLSPVAVQKTNNITLLTANNAVVSMAKVFVDVRYKVSVVDSSLNDLVWTGKLQVQNYSDIEDVAESEDLTIQITDNFQRFVEQKLDVVINRYDDIDNVSISALFDMSDVDFKAELKHYSLDYLQIFLDACQACIDLMIEQGLADDVIWNKGQINLYDGVYLPYYKKLGYIEDEIKVRTDEIAVIRGTVNSDGTQRTLGLQNYINQARTDIQDALNFENYIGTDLWKTFNAYRRESTFENANYISDGLNNAELVEYALMFYDVASNELYKSAELQHSISCKLKNLLVIEKFRPLLSQFVVGNWIRIEVDDQIYKLRMLSYDIDYDNLDNLQVSFSDVMKTCDGESDAESLMKAMASMATSYNVVQRQAKKGNNSNEQLVNWVQKGLDMTNLYIVSSADNQNMTWDEHGMLLREFLPITDTYDERQIKIINRGLYATKDNWRTSSAAIGDFIFWNPKTQQMEEDYGVIAKTLVGNLILGEEIGIYTVNGTMSFTEDEGLKVFNDTNAVYIDPNSDELFKITQFVTNDGETVEKKMLYFDDAGMLHIVGDGAGLDLQGNLIVENYNSAIKALAESIKLQVKNDDYGKSVITLTGNDITAQSQEINITGMVTFNDLSSDNPTKTIINGNNITTGTLDASLVKTGVLSVTDKDKKETLYVNCDTGEVRIVASQFSLTGEGGIDSLLTQQTVYNALTNNGKTDALILTDGKIYLNATYINTGTLSADRIKGGSLKLGGVDNGNGLMEIYDENDNQIALINNSYLQWNGSKLITPYEGAIYFDSRDADSPYYEEAPAINSSQGGLYIHDPTKIGYGDKRIWFKRRLRLDSGGLKFSIVQYYNETEGMLESPVESKIGAIQATYNGIRIMSHTSKTIGIHAGEYSTSYILVGKGYAQTSSENTQKQITVHAPDGVTFSAGTPLRLIGSGSATTTSGEAIVHELYTHSQGSASRLGISMRTKSASRFSGSQPYADFGFQLNGTFYCTRLECEYASVVYDKARKISTQNYNDRLLYCYEMPVPMFGDIGEGDIDGNGECVIEIDDMFSESILTIAKYQVFLQKEGIGDLWIKEKTSTYFIVEGTPYLHFSWELKAKQFDAAQTRMELAKDQYEDEKMVLDSPSSLYDNELQDYINEQEELLNETA